MATKVVPERPNIRETWRRRIAASLVAALVGLSSAASAGPLDDAAQALLDIGFESVAVSRADGVHVEYENRVFRYEMTAIGVAARLCADATPADRQLTIVPLNRGVPITSLSATAGDWLAFLNGNESGEWFRERLRIDPTVSGARRSVEARNPSTFKTDVALRPLVELQLGIADNPFQTAYWVAPEATMSPFRGTLLTAQAVIEIHDEFDAFARDVGPGRTTLTAFGRLPGSIIGSASAGYFPSNRYGVAWELGRLVGDGSFEVRLAGDYSGFLKFSRSVTLYSDLKAWSGLGSVIYRTRGFDLETIVTGGRFYNGDIGARVDMIRHFGEFQFGFLAIKTDGGSVGGFRFSVPLPVKRLPKPSRLRPSTVPAFPFEYREDLDPIGNRVRFFDNLDRFRKGLYPNFIRNNIDDLRTADAYVGRREER